MHVTRCLLAVLLLGATTVTVEAQGNAGAAAGAKGFFLGAAVNGSSLTADDLDDESETGVGLLLQLGFGFNPQLALFLEGSGASMQSDGESWILSHGDLGLRYHFTAPGRLFVPFIDAAFTAWSGSQDNADLDGQLGDLEISGTGFSFGGGFLYYFSSRVALNAQLKYTKGEFNKVRFENVTVDGLDIDASSGRFNVGLTWFLGGGR